MKKLLYLLTLLTYYASGQNIDYKMRSEAVLDQFIKNDFLAIYKQIDTSVSKKADSASIARNWSIALKQNGLFVKRLKAESGKSGNFITYNQICQFEKKQVNFRLIWGENDMIRVYVFAPVDERPKYSDPKYFNPAAAKEKKVLIVSGQYRIPGFLAVPNTSGKHPLVILVHGSGPNDKDETFGPLKPFKDLSAGLTSQGIAVLRYEKRTRIYTPKMIHDKPNYTVKEEVLEDIQKAIEVAKKDTSIDTNRIYIAGHSFGGMLLPRIAKENPSIKGLIYLTANARKLEDLFFAQAEYLANEVTDSEKKNQLIASAKSDRDKIKALTTSAATDSSKIFDSPASLWYDLNQYDQVATAKTVDKPMLFIFCARDYQVTSIDSDLWKSALKTNVNVTFKMYPKLNHFFVEGEGKSLPSEYAKSGNVDLGMINDMATWLKGIK